MWNGTPGIDSLLRKLKSNPENRKPKEAAGFVMSPKPRICLPTTITCVKLPACAMLSAIFVEKREGH